VTKEQAEALDRLAWDAVGDRHAPPVLALAAWRYVYRGECEPFLSLLRAAAARLVDG